MQLFDADKTQRDSDRPKWRATCPQCHSGSLVARLNRKTQQSFWGCDRYPACKFAVASLDKLKPPEGASRAASEAASATSNDELADAVRQLTTAVNALAVSLKHEKPTEELGK